MEAKIKKMFQMAVIMVGMFLITTVCPLAGEDSDYYEGEDAIRMMVWTWQPECNCSLDMNGAVNQCLEELAEETGVMVDLIRVSEREYMDKLVIDLHGERAPDVIWVTDDRVDGLAEREMIVSLNEVLEEMPSLIQDIPDEILNNFNVEGNIYAIPLGPEDELAQSGYAVTRTAMERGKLSETLELVSFIREQVPPRGKPDLVVSSFDVESETFTEGDRLTIIAEVKNVGEEGSEDTMVYFMLDDEMIDERDIEYLEPGESRSYRIAVEAPPAGMHDYTTIADLEGLVEENNVINNVGSAGGMFKGLGGNFPQGPKALWAPFVIQNEAFKVTVQEDWRHHPNVKLGFDGTNYLVIWSQQEKPFKQEYNHRLVGVRISQLGKILDTTPFVITKSAGQYDCFNLAFDGTNYLVVWEKNLGDKQWKAKNILTSNPHTVIQGARVSLTGTVLDTTPIDIESTPCTGCPPNYSVSRYEAPDVVFTGTDFLVVYRTGIFGWTQYMDGVDARFVTSSGTVKAKTTILTYPGQIEAVGIQRLAFNPVQQEGFLLFDPYDYAPTPYENLEAGIWIKVNGSKVTGSPLHTIDKQKAPTGAAYFCPAIAADGKGNYLGVFEGKTGVEAALIGPLPSKASAHKGGISNGWKTLPDVAFDGKNYTVVYTHKVGCGEVRVGAVRVTPGGVWSPPACYKNWAKLVVDTSITFGKINGLVVFTNLDRSSPNPADHSYQIVGMLINKSL